MLCIKGDLLSYFTGNDGLRSRVYTQTLYKRARTGEIKQFTGLSAPYEEPEHPEIMLETDKYSVKECVDFILNYLAENGYVNPVVNQESNP